MHPWICIDRSSRPPKAPPTPARVIRTLLGRAGRGWRHLARSTCSHCVATYRSTPPSSLGIASRTPGRGTPGPACRARTRPRPRRRPPPRRRQRRRARRVQVAEDVAALVERGGSHGFHGLVHVHERLEHLVVDPDQRGGAARRLGVVRRDDRDRLALVADASLRQHRLVRQLEPVCLPARHVLVRLDRVHARERQRLGEVDRADARVRVRAPQRRAPEHPVGPQVGGVGELAPYLERAVGTADALADAAPGERRTRGQTPESGTLRGLTPFRVMPVRVALPRRGRPDRVEDLLVAGAAAEVARERLADLGLGRAGVAREQFVGGDDQPGCAEPALHGAGGQERLLDRVELLVAGREPLDRHDARAPLAPAPAEHEAGAHERAVEVDRARAALALLAGVLRSRQAHALAQHVEQALPLPDAVDLAALAVDRALEPHRRRSLAARAQIERAAREHAQRVTR